MRLRMSTIPRLQAKYDCGCVRSIDTLCFDEANMLLLIKFGQETEIHLPLNLAFWHVVRVSLGACAQVLPSYLDGPLHHVLQPAHLQGCGGAP